MTPKSKKTAVHHLKPAHQEAKTDDVTVESPPSDGDKVFSAYQCRLLSLTLIKQLMHLCRDVQKHRGLGMGLLAGNQEFASRFDLLQRNIARRIEILVAMSRQELHGFSEQEMIKITESWNTIRDGWHDDSVLENFQFHSYFIEQILQVVVPISEGLESVSTRHAYVSDLSTSILTTTSATQNKDELLHFIISQLPRMIEFLGMVRALATHLATVGDSIDEHDKKLKYLCQCVHTEKFQIISKAEQLYQYLDNELPSLLVLKTYEYKVDVFIEKVTTQVIGQSNITFSSDDLFSMATEIMDVYWRVVDDGIDVLHHSQDEALEKWCIQE